MGGRLNVDWQGSADELKYLYQKEVYPQQRTRLQAVKDGDKLHHWGGEELYH